jgi:single-strand DNA-binding protein
MNDSYLTITGNLCESPKLRQTPSGAVVSELRVACTSRQWRADENRYIDGETSFYRVSCWGYLVIAHGRLSLREYEGRDGIRRVSAEIDARAVGHDLLYGTSTFARVVRSSPASALGIGGVDAVIRSASAAPQQPHGDDGLPGDDLQLQPYVEVDGMIIDRDGQIISEQVVAEHVPVIDSQDSNAAGQPGDDELAGSAVG